MIHQHDQNYIGSEVWSDDQIYVDDLAYLDGELYLNEQVGKHNYAVSLYGQSARPTPNCW
jgi:hypothetical protein